MEELTIRRLTESDLDAASVLAAKVQMEELTIRRLTDSDLDAATVLAAKVQMSEFSQSVPYINLDLKTDTRDNSALTKFLLESGYSYGAFNRSNKLIAIRMGYVEGRNGGLKRMTFDKSHDTDSALTDEEREHAMYYQNKIYSMMASVAEKADLYRYYNIDKALHFRGLAVDDEYKQKGVETQLTEYVIDTAVQCGIRCFYTATTGAFSARIFEKLGFEKLCELRYDEFLDEGKPVFAPPEPHYSVIMWAKCYPE